ncbi:MAG: hypothetical protein A3F11_02695 [Gammaproteobacteria bacterium RIFCSPHIGHO2_12_FULL_37_14]|nr:MAG: hypothetical protein A3F11_02695 [Gammaproteobacteria bacterium RIFCSPHIGHO2_12_FULL_37_14]
MNTIHPSWQACFPEALAQIDPYYLTQLYHSKNWLPGSKKIFNAFSLGLNQVKYVIFGESPYPRSASANGYAFWDAAIDQLWSDTGLSKPVNRATSFRNIIKMLLVAEGLLDQHSPTQENIVKIHKQRLVQSNAELFANFLHHGFLLLNATLVLSSRSKTNDAKAWLPFIQSLLLCIVKERPQVKFIIFGRIANQIKIVDSLAVDKIHSEHPYNHSFIINKEIQAFFKPLHLLHR